jgi:hypothetical protein
LAGYSESQSSIPSLSLYFIMDQDTERLYRYAALPDKASIRLVQIVSSVDSSIVCTMEPFKLAEVPKYHALSYTWGDPLDHSLSSTGDEPIMSGDLDKYIRHEDGSKIPVTANLICALQQLSKHGYSRSSSDPNSHSEPHYIWIDAICINQPDTEERNHQVSSALIFILDTLSSLHS